MPANEIRIGDEGTVFEVTLKDDAGAVDLTGLTSAQFYFKKPSTTVVTKAAVADPTPTTGILRYTTIAGDLDEVGCWQLQAKVVFPGGTWKSDIGTFHVYPNLA